MSDLRTSSVSIDEILGNLSRLQAEGEVVRADIEGRGVEDAFPKDNSGELSRKLANEAVGRVAAEMKKNGGPPPLPKKSQQWHYALDDESHGPVGEEELLQLLEEGAVKLSTLVWNKTMSEWTRLADTPLAEKALPVPPPLPTAKKKAKSRNKAPPCPSCGRVTSPEDSFCPDCGTPLKT
jgi:hypothetical protein